MFPITEVTDVDLAFPGDVAKLMPSYSDIPREFTHGKTKWNRLFADWFYGGVKNLTLTPRAGVDERKALRHIRSVMCSFSPSHEHKEAAVAFLLGEWFSDGKWDRA